ncbi:uncharacterized protein LACBIDRAFT_318890 [Laccaria bicolor S238N-H82]|uniref:Predicted protein n=1 Tax=Laccaria bicolor (strain S238N-H82 / ATCC MYA-4686) TaxID=486041 RepID=B0D7C7_LACBS|nr:uncharacterized protein LACBIDRAFT_318890 [Laccaria bicolor S238N-H82]EDR09628.1 predicted protein [Laccaria bicolor S238N-H82]|eukprot:XP_001879977.1 predicted protein [Laccaria bicolor S238N-H82]
MVKINSILISLSSLRVFFRLFLGLSAAFLLLAPLPPGKPCHDCKFINQFRYPHGPHFQYPPRTSRTSLSIPIKRPCIEPKPIIITLTCVILSYRSCTLLASGYTRLCT